MGILRTLLALLVVAAHIMVFDKNAEIGWSGGAVMAVNLFFLLSGFYMALILDEKYKNRLRVFYANRALRLLPLYWSVIIISLLFAYGFQDPWPIDSYVQLTHSPAAWWLIPASALANISFFGLNLGHLTCIDFSTGIVNIYSNTKSCTPLSHLAFVPQAWTLGIEATFYLFIPFILRYGERMILAVLVMGLLSKITLIFLDLNITPWNRNLFTTTIIYFMLGVVSFKLYKRILPALLSNRKLWLSLPISLFCVLSYTFYYIRLSSQPVIMEALEYFIEPIYFLVFVFLIPFLFHATKKSRIDSMIGELSYPIYITHFITLKYFSHFAEKANLYNIPIAGINSNYAHFVLNLVIVVLVATVGVFAIIRPTERLRRNWTKNNLNWHSLEQSVLAS